MSSHPFLTLTDPDILFLVQTLLPQRTDHQHLLASLRRDASFLESMLDDPALFQRLSAGPEVLVHVSPTLFFQSLLRQTRRDLRAQPYTIELRDRQRIPVFDSHEVRDLLADAALLEYLAQMLASFTRVGSFSYSVRVRPGVWRRQRVSELDVDSLIRLSEAVGEEQRFGIQRRIGDLSLFLLGIFPEHANGQIATHRPGARGRRSQEDYERLGPEFFGLAAAHEAARALGIAQVLAHLAEHFCLLEKPLQFLSENYLALRKHVLVGM